MLGCAFENCKKVAERSPVLVGVDCCCCCVVVGGVVVVVVTDKILLPLSRFMEGALVSFAWLLVVSCSSGFCNMLPMNPYSKPADSDPKPSS